MISKTTKRRSLQKIARPGEYLVAVYRKNLLKTIVAKNLPAAVVIANRRFANRSVIKTKIYDHDNNFIGIRTLR